MSLSFNHSTPPTVNAALFSPLFLSLAFFVSYFSPQDPLLPLVRCLHFFQGMISLCLRVLAVFVVDAFVLPLFWFLLYMVYFGLSPFSIHTTDPWEHEKKAACCLCCGLHYGWWGTILVFHWGLPDVIVRAFCLEPCCASWATKSATCSLHQITRHCAAFRGPILGPNSFSPSGTSQYWAFGTNCNPQNLE